MKDYTILIDEDFYNEIFETRYDNDGRELTIDERQHIFEMLMRKSELINEIESYIECYIDDYICNGNLDDYHAIMES